MSPEPSRPSYFVAFDMVEEVASRHKGQGQRAEMKRARILQRLLGAAIKESQFSYAALHDPDFDQIPPKVVWGPEEERNKSPTVTRIGSDGETLTILALDSLSARAKSELERLLLKLIAAHDEAFNAPSGSEQASCASEAVSDTIEDIRLVIET